MTDGALLLNGIDLRKMPQKQLRDHIAYVQQRAWLFAGTIRENLQYSNPNASDEVLWHALEVAQAADFVRSLPDGLDAFVVQGGTIFSGGQKQRIAIAGVLALKPKVVILDESTAMLDPRGRQEVLKTIRRLNQEHGTTVVFITHFMDEAVSAGRVIVVDDGKILMDSTPQEVFRHVEKLKAVGLDVPQVTELAYKLRKNGIPISDDILTVPDFVQAFQKIMEA